MPPRTVFSNGMDKRQNGTLSGDSGTGNIQSVPPCVTTCMEDGDISGCSSITDYYCLCSSEPYITSVGTCLQSSCNSTEVAIGETYAQEECAAFGVNVTSPSSTSSSNTTSPSSATSIAVSGGPLIYQKAFLDVQAIMSSICAALLLTAFCLGIFSCRMKIIEDRKAALQASGTWTGLGGTTFAATDSKNSGSRFGFKSKGQTDTFDSNFDITSTNTLGYSSGGAYGPGGVNRPSPLLLGRREPGTVGINRGGNGGFTNRLTLGEIDATEQWEMDVKSPGDSPASDMYPEAGPSTASSSGSMNKRGLSTADLGDIGNGGEERMFNESTSEVNVDEFKEGESFHPLGRAL